MGKLILLMFASSMVFLGCNPKLNSNYSTKPQTFNAHQELIAAGNDYYSYQYVESSPACDTGFHEFNDHADLCNALRDENLNHGCAREVRRDRLEQECR